MAPNQNMWKFRPPIGAAAEGLREPPEIHPARLSLQFLSDVFFEQTIQQAEKGKGKKYCTRPAHIEARFKAIMDGIVQLRDL